MRGSSVSTEVSTEPYSLFDDTWREFPFLDLVGGASPGQSLMSYSALMAAVRRL